MVVITFSCEPRDEAPAQFTSGNWTITVYPTTDDPEDNIRFKNITITNGILEEDYFTPWAGDHKKGEPCFLITGQIANNSGTRYWVTQIADGLDSAGNRVAGTLDAGPLVGIAQSSIEPHNTEDFILHLGWADNVTSFTVKSQKSDMMFP